MEALSGDKGGRENGEEPKLESLVKYSKPVVVSKGGLRKTKKATEDTVVTNTQDILNSILPPLEWIKGGQHYGEFVLSTPATRADVLALERELDKRLQVRRARETGICPIREELYAQCFDEIIREVTIICSHRGLLLVRVRDEMRMTIQAYQTLYESSLGFGMRFALKGEQNKAQRHNTIHRLTDDIDSLEQDVADLEVTIQAIEEEDMWQRQRDKKQHSHDIDHKMMDIENYRKKLEVKLLEQKTTV